MRTEVSLGVLLRKSALWIATNTRSIGRMSDKEIMELDSVLLASNLFCVSPMSVAFEVRACLDALDYEARENEYELQQLRG